MKTIAELREACKTSLEFLRGEQDITDAQVFVSANEHWLCRMNFTSHIPSNGVEEPKGGENFGAGITVVFKDGRVGSGSAESSLGPEGLKEALLKARIAAVKDSTFYGLPKPEFGKRILNTEYHDAELMNLSLEGFVEGSWDILRSSLNECATTQIPGISKAGVSFGKRVRLINGGDIQLIRERMAVASFAMPEVQSDETSMSVASITTMIEALNAKGSGFFSGSTLSDLKVKGADAARRAFRSALATTSGERIRSGKYTVVFGPYAAAELFHNLVTPGLASGAIYAEGSPFQESFLTEIASPELAIYDDGANPKFMGAKAITCEGLPTGKTNLITNGRFVGMLSSHYDYQRLLHDPEGARKLGEDPIKCLERFWPRNGFRFSTGAGRHFDTDPSASASNIIVTSSQALPLEKLLQKVENGIYIGRMWYVYPINGLRAGDFTGTVTADSFLIENGKLSRPLRPNAVRINDNIKNLLKQIGGVSDRLEAVNIWAADEAMYAGDILIRDVHLEAIADFVEMMSE